MNSTANPAQPALLAAHCIRALLPDDGTDRRLLAALLREQQIIRADSVAVRSVGVLHAARTRPRHLPAAELARLVTVIVGSTEADALFDYICKTAAIDKPGGGMVTMQKLTGATLFSLPTGLPSE